MIKKLHWYASKHRGVLGYATNENCSYLIIRTECNYMIAWKISQLWNDKISKNEYENNIRNAILVKFVKYTETTEDSVFEELKQYVEEIKQCNI
jgi:hypothetical protein